MGGMKVVRDEMDFKIKIYFIIALELILILILAGTIFIINEKASDDLRSQQDGFNRQIWLMGLKIQHLTDKSDEYLHLSDSFRWENKNLRKQLDEAINTPYIKWKTKTEIIPVPDPNIPPMVIKEYI